MLWLVEQRQRHAREVHHLDVEGSVRPGPLFEPRGDPRPFRPGRVLTTMIWRQGILTSMLPPS